MMDRTDIDADLITDEALRLKPYLDTRGKLTIGIGRNLTDKGISIVTARQMLDEDIDEAVADLATFPWFRTLDSVRQRVMVNVRFNLGPKRFRKFKDMLAAMQRYDYTVAAAELLDSDAAREDAPARYKKLAKWLATGMVMLLALTVSLHAEEPTPFRWPSHAAIPSRVSDAAVGVTLGLDAWRSLVRTDATTRRDYACRMLLTVGVSELSKALIHRTRPNGADRKSFFSEHTALASTAAHSPLTASLALTVGWGRNASGSHYLSDIGVGAGVGLLARKVCQ